MEQTPITSPDKKSLLRRILKIMMWLVLTVVLLLGSLLGLLLVYEDEVKAAIISELNKHLNAEVKISPADIDLTIVKSFPDCSIEFNRLVMMEALPSKNRDTLLYAGKLGLMFNVMDVWNAKYNIQKIRLQDGFARPSVLKNGRNNYTFWKSDGTSAGNDSIQFNLKYIGIENFKVQYKNKQQAFKMQCEINDLDFSGNFSEQQYDLQSRGKVFINHLTKDKTRFLKNKELDFSVMLSVQGNQYSFQKADLTLNKLMLELQGSFQYKDSLQDLKLQYNAPNLDIASALSLLPEEYKNKINDYESNGLFFAKGEFRYSNADAYSLKSDFGIKKGDITYKPNSASVNDLNLEGKLWMSPGSTLLELQNLFLTMKKDELSGSLTIQDFSDPFIKLQMKAGLHLENVQSFVPSDTLDEIKGFVKLTANVEGKLKDLKDKTFSNDVSLTLQSEVEALEVKFKGDTKVYAVESCSLSAKDREIEVQHLSLKRGSSDVMLNGKIPGVFNYLADKNAPLIITGSLFSKYLKLEDFMPENYKSGEGNDNPLIPQNMEFKLNAAIEKFSFAKFEATNITGEIEIKNQKAIVNDVKLSTMEGEAEIDAFADNSANKLSVVMRSRLKDINISQLFLSFNNFSQSTLTDYNLRGYATATIDFSGTWNNRLEADLKTIRSDCYLQIERGELFDFKPLLSLSSYVDIKDLQKIKFSSLQSHVEIDNQWIRIPKTTIQNSALNIDVWGSHSFNNDMDYHIKLLISDYLAKKRNKNDDEFGPVLNDPEDRRSAFILMTGTVDKPIIKYDRKGLKEKVKEDIKREKQTLKELKQQFREDIGLGRKDSTSKKTKKQEATFELEKPGQQPNKKQPPEKPPVDDEDF